MPGDGSRAATRFVGLRAMIANEFNPPRADVLMYMGGFGSSFPCETLNSGLCVCSEVTTGVGDSDVILLLSMPSLLEQPIFLECF